MRRLHVMAAGWFLGLAAVGVLLAGEAGVALKPAEIKAQPFRDAKSIGSLARGERIEIVQREGGWYRIKIGKLDGWVRMLSVRRGAARQQTTMTDDLLGLASGRAGTGKVVSTTGIRGLDEEDLRTAHFNASELKKVDGLAVTPAQAQAFAAAGKLAARRVDYLPEAD
jgi:Bacterial SH3 domain